MLSPLFGTSFEGGAVTVADANTGLAGVVSDTNSLVGANSGDRVGSGGLYFLSNGNVLVRSPDYNGGAGAITYIDLNGGNIFGESGFGAVIDVDNSLIGNSDDSGPIGAAGIDEFFAGGNHYYAIFSPDFDGGAGAVTFVDANVGAAGDLDSTNSLVGSSSGDAIGLFANYDFLPNNNIVLLNPQWNGNRGAATFIDLVGGMGLTGVIDDTNSVVGTTAGDRVGGDGITSLFGSNTYAILSPEWSNGGATAAGAITWGDIDSGVVGDVGLGNSLVGANTNDRVGDCCNINFLTGTTWYVRTQTFDANRSALTFFDPNGTLPVGAIDASNSLLGSTAGDNLGSGGIFTVNTTSGPRIVIESPVWDNATVVDAGAITTFLEASPLTGPLDASNSFVGSNANDRVGSGFLSGLSNGNRVIVTSTWNGNAGAVTFWNPNNALTGVLGAGNSLIGGSAGDNIGSFGVTEFSGSGRYYVLSPSWNGNMGAVTFGSITTGVAGLVSAANSLVGSTAGDRIGQEVYNTSGRLMVVSDTWNASRGAVTVLNPNAPRVGALTSANSLVGSNPGDRVGDFVQFLFTAGNTGRFALRTTTWNSNAGAVTIFDPLAPLTGAVSAANSLVGRPGDRVGSNAVTELGNGGLLVRSSEWSEVKASISAPSR